MRLHDEYRPKTVQPLSRLFPARSEEKIRAALVSHDDLRVLAVGACAGYGRPIHAVLLEQRCPHCHQRMIPLSAHARPGFCTHCKRWLGA
jgi:hypothetical protein